jgi:hypothetical protein
VLRARAWDGFAMHARRICDHAGLRRTETPDGLSERGGALRERGAPQPLIATTSYDLALEDALLAAGETLDVISALAVGRDRGKLFHPRARGTARVIDAPHPHATEIRLDERPVILERPGATCEGGAGG